MTTSAGLDSARSREAETENARKRGRGTAEARITARRSREARAENAGNRARAASARARCRHWHPAVPGVRAAVPAARRLAGGGSC